MASVYEIEAEFRASVFNKCIVGCLRKALVLLAPKLDML